MVETNRIIKLARTHAEQCIVIPSLTGDLALVTFHDASWANAEEDEQDGAKNFVQKALAAVVGCKKAKATKMKIRSQAGYVTFLAEACVATGGAGKAVMVDWRSASIKRVCRSTLAAETMSAVGALGSTQLLRAFLAQVFLPAASLSQSLNLCSRFDW